MDNFYLNFVKEVNKKSILSPTTYFSNIIEPISNDLLNQVLLDDKKKEVEVVLLEDSLSSLNEYANDYGNKPIHLLFLDSNFLERPDINQKIQSSNIHSISSPWEDSLILLRNKFNNSFPSFLIPYPYIPEENILVNNNQPTYPIVMHLRGVSEGRLHVIAQVLKSLSLHKDTCILVEDERKSEFLNALEFLGVSEISIESPETLAELNEILSNSSCFINPLFSAIRPLSHLIMHAFYKKIPVLFSDFSSSRLLPKISRKYSLGDNEEIDFENKLKEVIENKHDKNIEEQLHKYAKEYGDPKTIAIEIGKIINF